MQPEVRCDANHYGMNDEGRVMTLMNIPQVVFLRHPSCPRPGSCISHSFLGGQLVPRTDKKIVGVSSAHKTPYVHYKAELDEVEGRACPLPS